MELFGKVAVIWPLWNRRDILVSFRFRKENEDNVIPTFPQIQRLRVLLCVMFSLSGCAQKMEALGFSDL